MDPFAWMKPAAEPASSPVAVAEPPRPAPAPALTASAPTFVNNPWKLKELRRLYINLQDGSKVGYLDLATLAAVPESVETAGLLCRALAGLAPVSPQPPFLAKRPVRSLRRRPVPRGW